MTDPRPRAEVLFHGFLARLLSFGLAVAMTALILGWPRLFAPGGEVAHIPLLLVMWGLVAGYIHGVGFVPRHPLPRALLGPGPAYLLLLGGFLWVFVRP